YFKSVAEVAKLPLGLYGGAGSSNGGAGSSGNGGSSGTTASGAKTGGALVTLDQVADVRDASQDIQYYTRMNGDPAVSLAVQKQADANTIDTAKNVKARIADIQQRYPYLRFRTIYDQSQFVSNSIS